MFRLQRIGIKLGLDNIRHLLKQLDNPEQRYPAIHIAGTNGKGSTSAIIASILKAAGYRVGLFTSPHLVDFCERIRVNGKPILQQSVIDFTEKMRSTIDSLTPSFFEVNTAMAFQEFAEQKVDIAVVETGMGGRLDSTNVLQPIVTVITPIDFDHQYYLGDSLPEIAAEKAGIIKEGIPCVSAPQLPPALQVLAEQCQKKGSSLTICYDNKQYRISERSLAGTRFALKTSQFSLDDVFLSLPGDYQLENARLALETLDKACKDFPVNVQAIKKGLREVKWRGRIDLINQQPPVVVDVSHNPAGVRRTMAAIRKHYPEIAVTAFVFLQEDKDYKSVCDLLLQEKVNFFALDLPFGKPLAIKNLADYVSDKGTTAKTLKNVEEAFRIIRTAQVHNREQLWLFIGSHYLAGEVYSHWQEY